jgi:uncharacterized membrane protein YozB (DUF420 family)
VDPVFLTASSLLPVWAVVPIAAASIIVLAAHVLAIQQLPMPPRRRRIRTANGLLMMLIASLLAYALGVAPTITNPTTNPESARNFLLVWSAIMSLLSIVIGLAALDVAHTARIALSARRKLRQEFRDKLGSARDERPS